MGMKTAFHRLKERYVHFVEHQGFPIIVTVCVAVITATAVWTSQQKEPYVSPTPPVADHVSAAQLMQQSLREAATATPVPTEEPQKWQAPLADITILRPFDTHTMVRSGITGIWAIHDAVDLQCSPGDKVFAISDGVVASVGIDRMKGAWLMIDHGNGFEALYAGLAMTADYIAGDEVRMGATIGYAEEGPVDESDLPPHIHLRVTQAGQPIDPSALW